MAWKGVAAIFSRRASEGERKTRADPRADQIAGVMTHVRLNVSLHSAANKSGDDAVLVDPLGLTPLRAGDDIFS